MKCGQGDSTTYPSKAGALVPENVWGGGGGWGSWPTCWISESGGQRYVESRTFCSPRLNPPILVFLCSCSFGVPHHLASGHLKAMLPTCKTLLLPPTHNPQ